MAAAAPGASGSAPRRCRQPTERRRLGWRVSLAYLAYLINATEQFVVTLYQTPPIQGSCRPPGLQRTNRDLTQLCLRESDRVAFHAACLRRLGAQVVEIRRRDAIRAERRDLEAIAEIG